MKVVDRIIKYMTDNYEEHRAYILDHYTKPADAYKGPWQEYIEMGKKQR